MQRSPCWLLSALLSIALAAPLVACGSDAPDEGAPSDGQEGDEPTAAEVIPDASADPGEAGEAPEPSPRAGETRTDRLQEVVQGDVNAKAGFEVTVLSLSLESFEARRRKPGGVQLKVAGVVYNRTGRTLSHGIFGGALILHFEGDVTRIRLSPDAFKDSVTPDNPWRDGQSRLFRVETDRFPLLMLEYEPTRVEARLFAAFEDPVGFDIAAPLWKVDLNWLAARVAPVRGQAQVFQAEKIKAGPRGKSIGSLGNGEVVQLLYQSGDHFRVKAEEGTGWVEAKAVVVKNLPEIYKSPASHRGEMASELDGVAVKVHNVETLEEPPRGVKLDDGERLTVVDVELTNDTDKELRCSEFFVDFGPSTQRGPIKSNDKLDGAMACDKDRLASGQSVRGTLAFLRERHDVPVVLGYTTPEKNFLHVDIYELGATEPYRR